MEGFSICHLPAFRVSVKLIKRHVCDQLKAPGEGSGRPWWGQTSGSSSTNIRRENWFQPLQDVIISRISFLFHCFRLLFHFFLFFHFLIYLFFFGTICNMNLILQNI